jgi:predicted RNA-binding protein with PIN domain
MPRGTGIIATSECSSDLLSRNWQRLIITHIEEKRHKGTLIGAPLTDVKITVVNGKAHNKHTEGGDFRQATYRAVRQGLMKAETLLLEPSFDFRLELPLDNLGRAMMDIENMHGSTDAPEIIGNTAILTGNCPVATMRSYANELRAYTRGEGRISLSVGEYVPCHNSGEILEKYAYAPELDERNTPNSVFCKNGSGFVVPWYEVESYLDIETEDTGEEKNDTAENVPERAKAYVYKGTEAEDKELTKIFEATYGKIKKRTFNEREENRAENYSEKKEKPRKLKSLGEEYIFIDGYNFIFAWDELRKSSEKDFSLARDMLVRLMCDYTSFRKCRSVIVFDAYKRRGGEGSLEKYGDVTVVYTKEGETADSYIEKETKKLTERHRVRVVSSDFEEQRIILGNGGLRVSTKEFALELKQLDADIKEMIEKL